MPRSDWDGLILVRFRKFRGVLSTPFISERAEVPASFI